MASRSGPSARTTAWVARRQTNRAGGPSGTCAMTFICSGRSNSRIGRSGGPPRGRGGRPERWRGGAQMMLRGGCPSRALGNMGVLRRVHDHAPAADARGDAIDQGGQFVIVVHIGIEIALLLHHDFGAAGGQPNEIESKTGIERIAY